jgi:hypothetical protein
VPAVGVQGGAALDTFCREAGLGRDAAGCCIRQGMHEIEAVEADLAERPEGQRRERARGDAGAAGGRSRPVGALGPPLLQCRRSCNSPALRG